MRASLPRLTLLAPRAPGAVSAASAAAAAAVAAARRAPPASPHGRETTGGPVAAPRFQAGPGVVPARRHGHRAGAAAAARMSSAAEDQPAAPAATAPAAEPQTTAAGAPAPEPEPALPPLSAAEFRQYNRLAEQMDYIHDHFRRSWNLLWTAATTGRRPGGMTARQLLDEGLQFLRGLEAHHGIEEAHVFPVLARKMPEFRTGREGPPGGRARAGGAAELIRQHREIHVGMEQLRAYLAACRGGGRDLEMAALREKMESWGGVLWAHLDQEVRTLGAENMRRYWTLEEMRKILM